LFNQDNAVVVVAERRVRLCARAAAVVVNNSPPRRETRRAASEVDPALFFLSSRGEITTARKEIALRCAQFFFYFSPSPSEQDNGKDKCSGPGHCLITFAVFPIVS
jgi:hypothetical protein